MPPLSRRAIRRARSLGAQLRHGPRHLLALRLAASGLVDRAWYDHQTGRRWGSDLVAALHYVHRGRRRGLSVHPLLEPEWISPTSWRGRTEPVQLYLDGRSQRGGPHPAFDDAGYLATTDPAVWAGDHRGGPLGHFLRHHGEDDPLPVPAGVAPLTLRQLRERLLEVSRLVSRQDRLRGVRPTAKWDRSSDDAYVARWSTVEVPTTPDEPAVSIVLPVRNRPEQIAAAIRSVQAQTFAGWELLVVDDGSTDRTPDVVAAIAAEDERVRLIRIDPSGASVARNAGLAAARAHYVAFLDSDNAWVPHFLQVTLAAMTTEQLRAAHSVVEMQSGARSRYLAYAGGREALEFSNHVDLNVFVAELALVREVGSFDPSLRRMIDWDLALRVAAVTEPVLLPFVGVHYVEDTSVGDRISVREPTSWGEVALAQNLVDWAALREAVGDRDADLTSVVISVHDEWTQAVGLADAALAGLAPGASEAGPVEVVLVDRSSRPAVHRLLAARYAADPRVQLLRQPRDGRVALAWCQGLALTTGGVVVLVDARCALRASGGPLDRPWWAPLRAAVADPDVVAVAPLVLGSTGTVRSAGLGTRGPGEPPYQLFADFAGEDVVSGGPMQVGLLGDAALVARAADLVAVHGPSPWYVHGLWGADLSARLLAARPGHLLVVPDVCLVDASEDETITAAEVTGLLDRVGGELNDAKEWDEVGAWARAGLEVTGVQARSQGLPRPSILRARRTVESGPGAGLPALRWAIKIAAPSSEQGDKWGDVHFASDLATALERLGQHVVVDRRPAHERSTSALDDVIVSLRGLAIPRLSQQVNLLWVISHPDQVTPDEVRSYDLAFAASLPWSAAMTARAGVPVEPLLQATDPARFHPGLAEPDTGPAALFVGNSRGVERPVVRDALAAGVELDVYGTRWKDFIDLRHVRADYLPNKTVGAAYRAAGVLLNDHWVDMAQQGFISNRLFDAVAAGARVISDPVPGIDVTFSGAVLEYRTPDELARWIGPERDQVFPSQERLLQISAQVRRDHSFDARAVKLLDAVVAELLERSAAIAG